MTDALDRLKVALADRYKIERELGSGGMATVYLAEDLKHKRKVAVKVLKPELSAILGGERFLKEIEVTANLQHPNILPLYDSGEADTFLYYVMPYVEGETLRDKLAREKQLSVEDTVEIAKAVAGALSYAHSHGVIHRDIKPENILLESGQAVVADFGIALAVSTAGGNRLTESGLSLGTPQYMSPEQATGDRDLDARTDVYALGAVVYIGLAGPRGASRMGPPYLTDGTARWVEIELAVPAAEAWIEEYIEPGARQLDSRTGETTVKVLGVAREEEGGLSVRLEVRAVRDPLGAYMAGPYRLVPGRELRIELEACVFEGRIRRMRIPADEVE
ncbi:MAG: serine/threonine protein kinase [Gemmatimonadetes bacterium]|nr:serine/threonine protein kinase [Gemmatimonadota bacterium]